jgi:hypothetical protein
MLEFSDLRSILTKTLSGGYMDVFLYEHNAGARPESPLKQCQAEVARADVFVAIFGIKFGPMTIMEYQYARQLNKPCFIYVKAAIAPREPQLQEFIATELYGTEGIPSYAQFGSAAELIGNVGLDIQRWLVRRFRETSDELQRGVSALR